MFCCTTHFAFVGHRPFTLRTDSISLSAFAQVVSGLQRAATACGAGFRFGAEVVSIDSNGDSVTGVTLASGKRLAADIVVSNRDLPAAYPLLGGDAREHGSRRHAALTGKKYSAGVISYNWSVGRRFDQLQHHNVFLSGMELARRKSIQISAQVHLCQVAVFAISQRAD